MVALGIFSVVRCSQLSSARAKVEASSTSRRAGLMNVSAFRCADALYTVGPLTLGRHVDGTAAGHKPLTRGRFAYKMTGLDSGDIDALPPRCCREGFLTRGDHSLYGRGSSRSCLSQVRFLRCSRREIDIR